MLPRKVGAIILLCGSLVFYASLFGVLAGLQSKCPGAYYRDLVYLAGWLCLGTGLIACIGLVVVVLLTRKQHCQGIVSYDWTKDRKKFESDDEIEMNKLSSPRVVNPSFQQEAIDI